MDNIFIRMNPISDKKLINPLRSLFKRYLKLTISMIIFTALLTFISTIFFAPIFVSHHESASLITLDVCHQGSAFILETNSSVVIENFLIIGSRSDYVFIQEFSNPSIPSVFLAPEDQPPRA